MRGSCRCHLLQIHHHVPSQVEILLLMLLRGACHQSRRPTLVKEVRRRHLVVVARQRVLDARLWQLSIRMIELLLP